jgi:hypothetical protein
MSCNCKNKSKNCCLNRKTKRADWDKCLNDEKSAILCKPPVFLQKDNVNAPNSSNFSRYMRWANLNGATSAPTGWRAANVANFQDIDLSELTLFFYDDSTKDWIKQTISDYLLNPKQNNDDLFKLYIPYDVSKQKWKEFKLQINFSSGAPTQIILLPYGNRRELVINKSSEDSITFDRNDIFFSGTPKYANSLGNILLLFSNYAGNIGLPLEIIASNRGFFKEQNIGLPKLYFPKQSISFGDTLKEISSGSTDCSYRGMSSESSSTSWNVPLNNSGSQNLRKCIPEIPITTKPPSTLENYLPIIQSYNYLIEGSFTDYSSVFDNALTINFSQNNNCVSEIIGSNISGFSDILNIFFKINNVSDTISKMNSNNIPILKYQFNIKTIDKSQESTIIYQGEIRFNASYYLNWGYDLALVLPYRFKFGLDIDANFDHSNIWKTNPDHLFTSRFKIKNYKNGSFDYTNPCTGEEIKYNLVLGDLHLIYSVSDEKYNYKTKDGFYAYLPQAPWQSTFVTEKVKFFLCYGGDYKTNAQLQDLQFLTGIDYPDYSNNVIKFFYDITNDPVSDISNTPFTPLNDISQNFKEGGGTLPSGRACLPDNNHGTIACDLSKNIYDFNYRKPSFLDPSDYFNNEEDSGLNIDVSCNNVTIDVSKNINHLHVIGGGGNASFDIADNVIINVSKLDLSENLTLTGNGTLNLVGPFKQPMNIKLSMFIQGKPETGVNLAPDYEPCDLSFASSAASDQELQNLNFNLFEPVDISYSDISYNSALEIYTSFALDIKGTYPIQLKATAAFPARQPSMDVTIDITENFSDRTLFSVGNEHIILKANGDIVFDINNTTDISLNLSFKNLQKANTEDPKFYSNENIDISTTSGSTTHTFSIVGKSKHLESYDLLYHSIKGEKQIISTESLSSLRNIENTHNELSDSHEEIIKTAPNATETVTVPTKEPHIAGSNSRQDGINKQYHHNSVIIFKKKNYLCPGPGLCLYDLSDNLKPACCIHTPLEGNNGSTTIIDVKINKLNDLSNNKLKITQINLANKEFKIIWKPFDNNDTSLSNKFYLYRTDTDISCSSLDIHCKVLDSPVIYIDSDNYSFQNMNVIDNTTDISAVSTISTSSSKFQFNILNGDIHFPNSSSWPNNDHKPIRIIFQVITEAISILESDINLDFTPYTNIIILRPI